MSDQWFVGIASGVGVAIGLTIHQMRMAKKNKELGGRITVALKTQGPRTLHELSEDLGMAGVMGRGNVFNALNAMTMANEVMVIPAPEGTPQLQKVKFIKYQLASNR